MIHLAARWLKRYPDYGLILLGATLCIWSQLFVWAYWRYIPCKPTPQSVIYVGEIAKYVTPIASVIGMVIISVAAWRLGWKPSQFARDPYSKHSE